MSQLSETEIFELCDRALTHYKKNIEYFIKSDGNKDISSVLEQCLKPKIEKIDEAIQECKTDLTTLKNSFSLLKPRYIAALLDYKKSLENSMQRINQFSNFPMNLEEVKKEKNLAEEVLKAWYYQNYIDGIKENKVHSDF